MSLKRFFLADTAPADGRFLALCALIGFVGGGVQALLHRSEKTRWVDVVAAAGASALAAFAVGSLLRYLWGPDKELLVFPCVGVAGWIGVVLLDTVSQAALARVRTRLDDEKNGGGTADPTKEPK